MESIRSTIKGAIKIQGLPESTCINTLADALYALAEHGTIEIGNQSFSNIVISNQQPDAPDRDKIWWRQSNAGGFISLNQYINNKWLQVYPPPNAIFQIVADPGKSSNEPPPGFKLLEISDGLLSEPDYEDLMSKQAYPPGLTGPYTRYPAIYVGF
jgi:hypothetical protein